MLGDLSEQQIDQCLRSETVGRIGCHAGGRTYVVPITYAYDGKYVYGHTGVGRKVQMMRTNAEVCFEVDRVQNLANWQSVIAWGVYEELQDAAAERAMQLLMTRILPQIPSETSHLGQRSKGSTYSLAGMTNGHTVVFRIRITEKTGRFERTESAKGGLSCPLSDSDRVLKEDE